MAGAPGWANLRPPHGRNRLWRRLHHKRWHFVALVTDELFCGADGPRHLVAGLAGLAEDYRARW